MRSIVLVLAGILVGCSSDEENPDGRGGGGDGAPDEQTAHTGVDGGGRLDPVAVGFELHATLEADGRLTNFTLDGTDYFAPYVVLTFADQAYFSASSEAAKEGHFCTAVALLAPDTDTDILPKVKPDQIPTRSQALSQGTGSDVDNALLHVSWEVALNVLVDTHDCTGVVDAEKWGADAELLVDPFNGAHFGYGLGRMTEYLHDAYLADDETTNDFLAKYGDALLASYVAINDANGEWYGYDWTTTILVENDPETNQLKVDEADDTVVPKAVDGVPTGGALPEGYLYPIAYWYQDFVLLDLANLRDGAPQ